ncbi:MAG TPA: YheU family protein [Desulfuromonadales bacterium]|nr:YheU family protein [Desulfuromonadales bacterium]
MTQTETREYDDVTIEQDRNDNAEDGVDVPLERINPDTLQKLVEEFVTREWSDLADSDYTFAEKIEQVIQQLKDKRIKVVFDLTSETCNIVPADNRLR